jgi:hypothetical protein
VGDAALLALCAEADRELDSLYSRMRCEFLQNGVRHGQSQADAVAALLEPRLHWIKDGQATDRRTLDWNSRHYIDRINVSGTQERQLQHEVSTVLLLVEQPDRITRAREWISGLPDKIMPAEERQHVLTLFSHLEQAVKDRPRRITRTVHTRPHPAGSQPVSPERDQVIQDTVMAAMQAFKLHKTRSRGSRKEPRKESVEQARRQHHSKQRRTYLQGYPQSQIIKRIIWNDRAPPHA